MASGQTQPFASTLRVKISRSILTKPASLLVASIPHLTYTNTTRSE